LPCSDPVASLPLIREGKLRALGVTTGMRMPSASDIPPIGETGVSGFEAASWIMIAAPANTPREIAAKLNAELKSIAQSTDILQQLVSLGMIPVSSPSPEALQRFVGSEIAHWPEPFIKPVLPHRNNRREHHVPHEAEVSINDACLWNI
jgi:tripartite-type tricarboxylate transporter receptor subunit TctC